MIWQAQKTNFILSKSHAVYKSHSFLALCLNVSRTGSLNPPVLSRAYINIYFLNFFFFQNYFNRKAHDFESGQTQAQVFTNVFVSLVNVGNIISHMYTREPSGNILRMYRTGLTEKKYKTYPYSNIPPRQYIHVAIALLTSCIFFIRIHKFTSAIISFFRQNFN